jgi:diguanylate cyclase (GGDEF)-like protein
VEHPGPEAALVEAAHTLSGDDDVDAMLARVVALATGPLGFHGAVVYLFDMEHGTLDPAATAGSAADAPPAGVSHGDPAARAARERRTIETADRRAVPLLLESEGGTLAGVLEGWGAPHEPSAANALSALADLAAVAIERSRLQGALDERSEWFERLSEVDPLTGLANKRTLVRAAELELLRANRLNTTVGIILFRIADFGPLNERLGRAAGDDALRRVASVLVGNVRLIDTVARYGVDEFVVLGPGAVGPALEERLIAAAATETMADGTPLTLRAGRAVYPNDGASADELLVAAERRLRERTD